MHFRKTKKNRTFARVFEVINYAKIFSTFLALMMLLYCNNSVYIDKFDKIVNELNRRNQNSQSRN